MYRAIRVYDGSDSEKCISLMEGDVISSVHSIDSDWCIGHNERSGETGTFPASYVAKDNTNSALPDKGSKQNTVTFKAPNDFPPSNLGLKPQISQQESVLSWQDSSFESTFQASGKHVGIGDKTNAIELTSSGDTENSFRKKKREKLDALMASTEMLFNSGREENRKMKAVFGIFAGLVIGGLLFALLSVSFEYDQLVAGIFALVFTIFICIGLALFPACRCVMALVFPNFFTGKGRAILLSVIFAVMLSGPISNITHNAKETGSSFACAIDLIANQTKALQRQLEDPVKQMALYVDQQKEVLKKIKNNIDVDFDSIAKSLSSLGNDFQKLDQNLNSLYQECIKPITDAISKCRGYCDKLILDYLKGPCLTVCSQMNSLTDACSELKLGSSFQHVSDQLKTTLDLAKSYYVVDIKVEGTFGTTTNSSKDLDTIQDDVDEDIGAKVIGFQTFMTIINYALSLSLVLMFVQAYLYFRNYMAKDGYDNVYITKEFKELDKTKEENGEEVILPLKKTEQSEYINASSPRLKGQEFSDCKVGLAQVFLHFTFCLVVIIFDYSLYYILNLVHRFGNIDVSLRSKFRITVDAKGNLASFYRTLFQGINFNEDILSELHVGKCLPKPTSPDSDYVIGLILLYLLAVFFVMLRGYGMRLRRKIAAYYYPEQETARMEYLHKTIRHRRIARQRFLRQEIKSTHKESVMKEKFRVSTWLMDHCPCFGKCIPSRKKGECSSCEERPGKFRSFKLAPCSGLKDGKACTAIYCEECMVILNGVCPLCSQTEDIELRD